jgi:tight adherence protein C
MVILLILAIVLIGIAVALLVSSLVEPRIRRSEYLAGIEAYGYAGRLRPETKKEKRQRKTLDDLATSVGDLVARNIIKLKELEVQRELVSAGYFNVSARRFLGYRVLLAVGLPVAVIWLLSLAGDSIPLIILFALVAAVIGWLGPSYYVHYKARVRLRKVDEALPGMIDLLVVTLEAGVAFTAALRMAADRLTGPLGDEIRLTIQEQSLGLSLLESFENWLRRCDTPSVRSFVRAMVQGDRLGVSIGQILRNQAVELRARQKHMVEERAQKAPVKILFPLVFLIFPAMFVVILGPALFAIAKNLKA